MAIQLSFKQNQRVVLNWQSSENASVKKGFPRAPFLVLSYFFPHTLFLIW